MPFEWMTLADDFIADQPDWSSRTRNWYRDRLKPFAKFLIERKVGGPEELNLRHVNRFMAALREADLSWSTRNGAYTAVRGFFFWMRRLRMIDYNPFADGESGLKRPRRTRRVVKDLPMVYIQRMIAAASREDTVMNRRDLAIMILLITTGLRRGELATLKLSEVDLETGEVLVRGKGGHERSGFLLPQAVWALKRWLEVRPQQAFSLAVFVTLKPGPYLCQPLKPEAINDILLKWRNEAALPKISVSPHRWRHTFATQVAKAKNPFALRDLLGHVDIKTTDIYVHPDKETLREVALKYGPKVRLTGN